MSEMVERVAAALRRYDVSGTVSRVLARAAIEAMREPSEAILRAGYEAQHPKPGSHAYGFETWATWEQACQIEGWVEEKAAEFRAMIDAALTPAMRGAASPVISDDGSETITKSTPESGGEDG